MFKKFMVIVGALIIAAVPCCAKSINGIETTARQHVIVPSPFYNGVYNNHYYTTGCYRTRKVKTKDENGKTVVYKETYPCGSGRYGYGGGYYGLNYNPHRYIRTYYPHHGSSIGIGSSVTIKF